MERVNAQELSGDPGRTLTYGLLLRRQPSSKTKSAKDKDIGDRDDRACTNACTSETQKLLELLAATLRSLSDEDDLLPGINQTIPLPTTQDQAGQPFSTISNSCS